MRLTVSHIPESGIEEDLKLPLALYDDSPEKKVHVHFKAFKLDGRVFVKGTVASDVPTTCSRCLKTLVFPLNVNIDVQYIPLFESGEGEEKELKSDELDVSFYQNDEIDIVNMVKEQMLLSVPMKPLCDTDCKGICHTCGINLNEALCKCNTEVIDPRLEPLKKLKESLKHRKE